MFAVVNFGVIWSFSVMYFQNDLPVWLILTSALISFVLLNALLLFLYNRLNAPKRD